MAKASPEQLQRQRAACKRWREKNPGKQAALSADWRKRHPDKQKASTKAWHTRMGGASYYTAQSRKWYANNKDKSAVKESRSALHRRRRAAKWGVAENFTPYQRGQIRKQFGRKCFRCGATKKLSIDHNEPLCAGNALAYGNAVLLCRSCNSKKGTKQPEFFYTTVELIRLEVYLTEQRSWIGK